MKRRTFVVRVWMDGEGRLRGQISDPFSEWRRPFDNEASFWAHVRAQLNPPFPSSAPGENPTKKE